MIITLDLTFALELLAYLLIGFGIGYLVTLGVTGGPTNLDRAKHDLEVKKEWLRMLADQKRNKSTWPNGWK